MKTVNVTDDEIEEMIRDAIEAYCRPDIRDAVVAWFNERMSIVTAVVELDLVKPGELG
jgi:hypothetical protein